MVVTRILATPSAARATAAQARGDLGVALYNMGSPSFPAWVIRFLIPRGSSRNLRRCARGIFSRSRSRCSRPTGLSCARSFPTHGLRTIALDVELVDPEPWTAQAKPLADALRFLSGDIWYLRFHTGGQAPPDFAPRLTDRDCACLFSGGLDSLIGAMNLIAAKRRPFIISQASPKEGNVQSNLAERIGLKDHRFEGRVIERGCDAIRAVIAGTFAAFLCLRGAGRIKYLGGELIVPENGLISINPPLTRAPRRLA